MVQFEEIPHEDATEARFMELDTDQDGLLSPAEFLPFLRQMLGAPSDAGSLKSAPNLTAAEFGEHVQHFIKLQWQETEVRAI